MTMKDYAGNHTTPKQMAEQILMDAIVGRMEFFIESQEMDGFTEAQKRQVYRQAVKIAKRTAKVMHFDPESFAWS